MNDVATKADISRLESEVLSLKSLFLRFLESSGSKVISKKNSKLDMTEPTSEELMKHAADFEIISLKNHFDNDL